MKIALIINFQPTLNALANEKLPAKVAYAIGKTINKMLPITQEFEMRRMGMLQQLGTLNQEQQKFDMSDENMAKFNTEMATYVETEIDFQPHAFTLADLGDTKIEPMQIVALEEFGMLVESIAAAK